MKSEQNSGNRELRPGPRIASTPPLKPILEQIEYLEGSIQSRKAEKCIYYWLVSELSRAATAAWIARDDDQAVKYSHRCMAAVLTFFYGQWREVMPTRNGEVGDIYWRRDCLWYEEVQRSLPFASALSNWEAVRKIAAYPPEDRLPVAAKAKGETAWGWALIYYLRGEPLNKVEAFLVKAEGTKAKRPKMLTPILRALMAKDESEFSKAFLAYLRFFQKSEFRNEYDKLIALDGTTLFHLGRKLGFKVSLPDDLAVYIVQFSISETAREQSFGE